MNKILREEMEYLIYCDDKAITPDVKDDVSLTLQYIDELENKNDKAIKEIKTILEMAKDYEEVNLVDRLEIILKTLRGKDKPEYLGYSDKECINCGRLRVEKYSDGTEICEKCNFDQNKKEYVLRGEDNEI